MRTSLATLALIAAVAAGRPSLDTIWSLLTSAWSASCGDAGLGMDPDGGCRPAPQSDEGLGMDPDGKPAPQADEGLIMDPNGTPGS